LTKLVIHKHVNDYKFTGDVLDKQMILDSNSKNDLTGLINFI